MSQKNRTLRFAVPESFGGKIILAFIVVIIAMVSAYTTFSIVREGNKAKSGLREQGEMLTELLAQSAVVGVFSENGQLLARIAEGAAGLKDVALVSIYNADLDLLHAAGASSEKVVSPIIRDDVSALGTAQAVSILETPDSFIFLRHVMIKSAASSDDSLYFDALSSGIATPIGYVRIVLSKGSYRKEILSILVRNTVIALIFILCGIAVVSVAVAKVTRPLKRLTRGVKDLGRGVPVERVPVETRDEIGDLASAFNAMLDERGQAEDSLRQSEKKFRMLTETAAASIFICQDSSLRYLNSTTEKMTGYTRDELLRMNFLDLIHPEYRQLITERSGSPCKEETAGHLSELKIVTKAGEERWIDFTSGPIEFEGQPALLGTAYDVTERKKLEAQFLQSHKMEAVGLLAGGVAHDFNNMLTAISGYGYVLKMKTDPADPRFSHIEQILAASDRAANLTRSLLAFGRQQVIDLKRVDANEIIISIGKLLGRIIGEDIELKLDLTGRDMTIQADSGQIGQVLMNLATNARDAMPSGGALTIKTEQAVLDRSFISMHGFGKVGKYALFSVTDTGMGIPEKTQGRIFEPFFTTKETGKGSGLGLSIVYGIIKQHDGYITVFSEPGMGTTFRIYFPLVTSAVEHVEAAQPVAAPGGSETVLLAEDDAAVRSLATTLLAESGYTVIEAADGEQAISKFVEHKDRINLLILDVIMPRKNGYEVFEEIQRFRPETKTLFMSGYTGDIFRKKNIPEQDLAVIEKPISPTEFLRRIRESLDGKSPLLVAHPTLTASARS